MKGIQNEHKGAGYVAILALCYLLALLIFSCYTSPIYPNYHGYDSAIFSLVGKGLAEGKALYTDLFDHKGPLIFFVTALGHFLGGRGAIFALQGVFGLVSLFFCYQTGVLLRPEKKYSSFGECFFIIFSVYAVYFFTFQRGNLTEEYSLPFISCSLYLLVRYADEADTKTEHPPVYALIHGFNLGCLAFFRLNNAASVAMGVLVIAVNLVHKRKFKNLLINLVYGLVGLAAIAGPILLYFLAHSALYEMLYATFIHNFMIAGNTGHLPLKEDPVKLVVLYMPLVICCLLFLQKVKTHKRLQFMDILLIAILAINVLALWIANRFPHYFTIFSPVYAAFLCKYLIVEKRQLGAAVVAICTCINLAFACYFSYASLCDVYFDKSEKIRDEIINSDARIIPKTERDSVIGFRINAKDYLSADIIPCYKYYTLQDTWAITNPSVMVDFMEWVETEKPLWVIVEIDEDNQAIRGLLEEYYELKCSNEYISFFRVTEPQ